MTNAGSTTDIPHDLDLAIPCSPHRWRAARPRRSWLSPPPKPGGTIARAIDVGIVGASLN